MWEKSLVESRGIHSGKGKWLGWPASFCVHGCLLAGLVMASFWYRAPLRPMPVSPPLVFQTFVVPSAPPPLGNGGRKPSAAPATPAPIAVEKHVPVSDEDPMSNDEPELAEPYDNNSTISDINAPGVPWGVDGDPNSAGEGVPGGYPAASELPVNVTPEMQQPVLVKKVEPPYPPIALQLRIEGIVILQAVITRTGSVEEVTVQRSVHPLLDQAAVSAVKQWVYRPAMSNGRSIKVYFTVTVNFHIR